MVEVTQPKHGRLDFEAIRERLYPLGIGIVTVGVWLLLGHKIVAFCVKEQWHIEQMYTAVFAFLAITTGFLATFYCTILCMSEGFVGQIKDTEKMRGFLGFVKGAILLGFIVSIASIPMMVAEPVPVKQFSVAAFVVAFWIGASAWAIAAFYRVASLFFFLFEARIKPRRPAG
ncbi:MAG: hypothetical protein KGJ66_14260 [Alphaproteobacteria bacterium]|nr:hypothetical protein [Alphaproteobacteria bacterium]